MSDHELAIIGAGLIGAAAARHAASAGLDIVVIGPAEPDDWPSHDGPFASHYDSGRITRYLDASPIWAELAARAIAEYPAIEASSGITFHHPVGVLWADRGPAGLYDLRAAVPGVQPVSVSADEATGRFGWAFSPDHTLAYEAAPAGYIDPRRMVRAQLTAAVDSGARIVPDIVERLVPADSAVTIELRSGDRMAARRVIVAAGAYTRFLLDGLVDLPIVPITAAVILGELTPQDAAALAGMPAMIHRVGDGDVVDVYAVPPTQYPDGRWYVKLGAEVLPEVELPSSDAVDRWMRGGAEAWQPHLRTSLQQLLPDIDFLSVAVKPCMYARTPSHLPIVDRVGESLLVAAGGNGRAAKSADAIGALVVDLVRSGRWTDSLDGAHFRVSR